MRHLRWLVGTVLVAAIVGGCITAGFWQLRRLDERRADNERVRERSAVTVPLPADGFSPDADADDLAFRRVRVTGTYDPDHEVLIRFRSRRGLPGYEVVTPLLTGDGDRAVLVDRGWVPLVDGDHWPVEHAAPPTGRVEVEGILAPPEDNPVRLTGRPGPGHAAIASAIDPDGLDGALPYDAVYRLPVLAISGGGTSLPVPVDPPDLGEGPHRSYAVQWFLFATVGVVGWAVLLRRRGPFKPRPTLAA